MLAERLLTPSARKKIDRLLSLEPGETLASISTWADEHCSPATGPWHYVNFSRDSCVFEMQRDCSDGRCVVEAINLQEVILGSDAFDEKSLHALKYQVHFVGDVHGP